MTNKPVIQTRDRNLSVSVFCHEKDGKTYYGANLQRSYKKPGDNDYTRENINLFPDDLLRLSLLCQRAYQELTLYLQMNRRNASASYPAQQMEDQSAGWDTEESSATAAPAAFDDAIPF